MRITKTGIYDNDEKERWEYWYVDEGKVTAIGWCAYSEGEKKRRSWEIEIIDWYRGYLAIEQFRYPQIH